MHEHTSTLLREHMIAQQHDASTLTIVTSLAV